MKNVLVQETKKLNNKRKQKKWWRNIVRCMAAVVVFCTTYALILPAITMEQEPICGLEVHEHVESCYAQKPVAGFACNLDDAQQIVHSHDAVCYDDQLTLICLLPELEEHVHDENCYFQAEMPVCDYTHAHSADCVAPGCGLEETEGHSHSSQCTAILVCELQETEGHAHSESCGSSELQLTCSEAEGETHIHGDDCYETVPVPCDIPETAAHTHGEDCYAEQEDACGLEEKEAHTHSEGCYAGQDVSCGLISGDDHIHEEACYPKERICGLEEIVLHTHAEECYDAEGALICALPQIIAHNHSEECLVQTEQMQDVLICGLEEHVHEDSCYPAEDGETVYEYICGIGVHAHVETCFDEAGVLICTIPEHAHEAACVVEDLDLTADVENLHQWEQTLDQVGLTGNWPEDVLAVAQSQLGYQESKKNVILEENDLKGYTRYGQWYEDPYGDWDAMYASFCLHYAGVKDFPLESEVIPWIDLLAEQGLYLAADAYTAKPGDLIFFDYDQKKDAVEEIPVEADHVGIVAELIPAAGTEPAKIKTIEGNTDDKVAYVTYELDDPAIIGYGQMPYGETFYMTYEGLDYTVTVKVGRDAFIPESAELVVREIERGTEEYNSYYQQSVEALIAQNEGLTEQDLDISFARFFDITFLVDGETVEPTAAVDIKIQYAETFTVKDSDTGLVVHFAEDGTEVLDADTNDSEENEADTFEFSQGSFSVSGTLIATREVLATQATRINPNQIDTSGATLYVLYTQIGGNYYALDGNGRAVRVTVSNNTVTLGNEATNDLFWSINSGYIVGNLGTVRYLHPYNNGGTNTGTTTANPYDTSFDVINNGYTFRIRGANNNYLRFVDTNSVSQATTSSNNANIFQIARVGQVYNVWFDGTDGGMMSYYGAADQNMPVLAGTNGQATVTLPETWQSSTKYDYTLRGWYDVYNYKYYPVNPDDDVTPTATITGSTVFYADWVASTYDVGQNNEHVVNSLDTNNFITTHVFDYNALFNVMSQTQTGTISAASHKENWSVVNNGNVPYGGNVPSLGFSFIDYDANGEFSYPNGRNNANGDDINTNQGDRITAGILQDVRDRTGKDLLDLLFNPNTDVIGKYYAGTGNYLFQYMDSTTENYDGVHDGYYYLDARLNAASYNQTMQRFYLYNYLERTSDSDKDGGVGQYSDFLPFNSPYLFDADQLDEYSDSIRRPGYEYDAKDGGTNHPEYNSLDDANTNYFFGIRTDINFFLPNDSGSTDEYGNYGNISTRGEHMIFDFHGDDDVWVFVDGELVLDIGGLHGVMFGQVDFSSGTVITGKDGGATTSVSFRELLGHNIGEGTHTMTVYYMERGSSQSNCAIYFNIAPRYDLQIIKEDIVSAERLNGAVFTIYNDEKMDSPAQLWDSEEAYNEDMRDGTIDNAKSTFRVVDGVVKCWGISAGKTYYIHETTPPPGYPESDDLIRITLNNRGSASIETTTLHGENGVATEGFGVIGQEINETLKFITLTITNQKEGDHTEVRVEKSWAEGSTNLPQSITVYLTADGVPLGRRAILNEANGWSYTWTGLDKYRADGADQKIVYKVQEVLVPGFITTQGQTIEVVNYVDWIRVDQMSDSKTFLLVHNGQALTYNSRGFGWMEPAEAELDESLSAQWSVTTDHDGFHLKNGLGYTLTYGANGFYGINDDKVSLNQVFYYLNSRLMVHDHDVYYQFGTNGSVVSEDGLAFTLYQKEEITGFLTNIVNVPVDEEDQTYVEVNKVWSDGEDMHTNGSVVIRLYADGKDTGRYITLDASNNWQGGFYDLPYYQEDGETVVLYTVVEDPVHDYHAEYSDPTVLDGLPVQLWQDTTRLTEGSIFRFTSGAYALAVDSENKVTALQSDPDDKSQQWEAVSYNGGIILRNVESKLYLARDNLTLSVVDRQSGAQAVTISGGYVMLGSNRYLELGAGYAGVTASSANISNQKVTEYITTYGQEGTGYTVTNIFGAYVLPVTGSTGTLPITFGGLLIIAAALMYITKFGRKQQRGGKQSNS